MIFISGIHGVGKTFFCNLVKKETEIETYSASALITQKKHAGFSKDKLISDIRSVYKELHADHETGAADNK